jgi:hypothetical protein
MNIEPSVPGNRNYSLQADSSRISTSFPTGARRWVRSVWVSKKKSLHVPWRRREASIPTTRQLCDDKRTYSFWSAGTNTSLSSEHVIEKMTAACRNCTNALRQFDWLHRSLAFHLVHHSVYVLNNLDARQTDIRQLKGFTESHVKMSLYLNKNRISNFDVCTVHVVQV